MAHRQKTILFILLPLLAAVIFSGGCDPRREKADNSPETIDYPDQLEGDPSPVWETHNLTVGWIQRLPVMNYVWKSPDPAVEGWPAEGQAVVWRAFVKNWSSAAKYGVTFQWLLDGTEVDSGTMDIPAGGYASADFSWDWTFQRHTLNFVVEPEEGERNHLTVFTDALAVGLYVEQSLYDYFHRYQPELGIGSHSFEGWAQRQMRMWNKILEDAVYPDTPNGVLDRMRIDKITVVPDGSLPLVDPGRDVGFESCQSVPNLHDRTVDMQWGFPSKYIHVYDNHTDVNMNNQFYYSGFLQHELGHARYLIDTYGFDVYHGTAGGTIDITEDGLAVAGSRYMPGTRVNHNGVYGIRVHETQEEGMMNTDWTFMDRYSAVCLNRIAGQRATAGNFNEPENLGEFLNDLPAENRFTLTDQNGYVLKGAKVDIYQASPPAVQEDGYPRVFDNTPDRRLTADEHGRVLLGRCPFSDDGIIHHDWDEFSNTALIMRVEDGKKVGYVVIDVSLFNLEYWRGNTGQADYTVSVNMLD